MPDISSTQEPQPSSSAPPSASALVSSPPAFWLRAGVATAGPGAILAGWIWGAPQPPIEMGSWKIPFATLHVLGIVLCVVGPEKFGSLIRSLVPWGNRGDGK